MPDIDVRALMDDEFVIYFGGRPSEVDVYTFGNALIAISDAITEINRQINPSISIEIRLDALGGGSFKAKVKTRKGIISSILGKITSHVVVPILVMMIWEYANPPDKIEIIVNDDSYIVRKGNDRIILPKEVYERRKAIRDEEPIRHKIAQAFQTIEEDPNVDGFGIAEDMHEPKPLIYIPRTDFGRIAQEMIALPPFSGARDVTDRVKLSIIRAILQRGGRKWQFVWNGVRISAPIRDNDFFDRLARREYQFSQGDALDVTLRIIQRFDESLGVYLNEAYEVLKVHGKISGGSQIPLHFDPPER